MPDTVEEEPATRGALPPGARTRPAAPPGLPRPEGRPRRGRVAGRRPAPAGARAGAALRLQRSSPSAAHSTSSRGRAASSARGAGARSCWRRSRAPPRRRDELLRGDAASRPGSRDPAPRGPAGGGRARSVAAALSLEPGSPTLYLERLRLAAGSRCCSRWSTCRPSGSPGCSAPTSSTTPSTTSSTERYGTPVARAREALEPVLLPGARGPAAGPRREEPRAPRRGHSRFPPMGHPIEFGRTYVRGDRTRYYVERVVFRTALQSVTQSVGAPGPGPAIATRLHPSVGSEPRAQLERKDMHRRHRLLPILATVLLVASACSTSSPSGVPGTTNATAGVPGTTAPEPTAVQTFAIPSFSPAALRWYCCLGTGEDPTQKPTEDKVAAGFATKHPGSSMKFEVVHLRRRGRHALDADRPEPAGHRRPGRHRRPRVVQGPMARPRAVSRQVELRHVASTTRRRSSSSSRTALQVGVPFDVYPSMLWYKKDFFSEIGLAEPPHE